MLACATFPLVWVGGLVTTTDAGMAVPDWPNTYGYNLFLYPWQTWLAGPWDLFVEHGHRLLAAAVGMLTIGLLVVLWRTTSGDWVRGLGFAALGAGDLSRRARRHARAARRADARDAARLHRPAVLRAHRGAGRVHFATLATRRTLPTGSPRRGHVRRLAVVTCVLAYLQIVLGAVLRHVPVDGEPATFALAVRFHLFLAAVLSLHIVAARVAGAAARSRSPAACAAWRARSSA